MGFRSKHRRRNRLGVTRLDPQIRRAMPACCTLYGASRPPRELFSACRYFLRHGVKIRQAFSGDNFGFGLRLMQGKEVVVHLSYLHNLYP